MAAAAVKINGRTPLGTYFSIDGKGFFASSGGGFFIPDGIHTVKLSKRRKDGKEKIFYSVTLNFTRYTCIEFNLEVNFDYIICSVTHTIHEMTEQERIKFFKSEKK